MPESHNNMAEVLSSPLVQYLDRRRSQPVGVVDVQQLQPRFLKVSDAIAQRLSLLARLQTRYGIDEEQFGSDAELTLANLPQPLSESNNSLSEIAQTIATITKSTSPTTIPERDSQPAETFRISRKVLLPPFSPSGQGKAEDKGDTFTPKTTVLVSEPQVLSASESFPSLPLKKSEIVEQNDVHNINITNQIESVTLGTEIHAENKHTASSQLPLAKAIITQHKIPNEPISLPLTKVKSIPLSQEQKKQELIIKQRQTINVDNQVEEKHIQLNKPALAKTSAKEFTLKSTHQAKEQSAIATEIVLNQSTVSQPKLIWRKNNNVGAEVPIDENAITASPLALNPVNRHNLFRTNQPIQPHNNHINAITPSAYQNGPDRIVANANLQPSKPEPLINVAQIAEQVSRILSRQLTVERERRGIGR